MEKDLDTLLQDYLEGKLGPGDKAALAKRIETEPAVKKAFQEAFRSHLAIERAGDARLKAQLQLRKPLDPKVAPPRRRLWWLAAAAVLAILLTIVGIWQSNRGPDWETYALAFPIPIAPTNTRNDALNLSQSWQEGSRHYMRLQFGDAIDSWKSYLADTLDPEIYYFVGMSYLQLKQADSAAYYLNLVPADNSLAQRASWYRVQCCLIEKDLACFKSQLENIKQQDDHYQQAQAAQWLEDLR
jgi:hypothetical protein